jgi:hypothetical protein
MVSSGQYHARLIQNDSMMISAFRLIPNIGTFLENYDSTQK